MITPENLVRHELIGLPVKVVESANKANVGLSGKVLDESRQILIIETKKGVKKLAKDTCVFSFKIGGQWIKVGGKILVARPEDRVKKKFKKW